MYVLVLSANSFLMSDSYLIYSQNIASVCMHMVFTTIRFFSIICDYTARHLFLLDAYVSIRVILSKVAYTQYTIIILSPSTIEASHTGLMGQFELFAIITQPIALMSVAACLASGRVVSVHLIPLQASQTLSMARYATSM